MLEELLANTMFTPALIAVGVSGAVCFAIGWMSRGSGASKREAELKRDVIEAKGSVPQLESSIRNRDQQISRLSEELKDLTDRNTELYRSLDGKERELRTATREARNLTSELSAVKGLRSDENSMVMDGFDDDAAAESEGGSVLETKLKKTEALYEKLKGALIKRDERIETLEEQLAGSDTDQAPSVEDHDDNEPVDTELNQTLRSRDQTIEDLQSQISGLRQEKEMLEDLASRRSKSNRALKDATVEAESRLPELEKQVADRQQTISDREASIKRLLGDLESAKGQIESHESEATRLNKVMDSQTQQLDASNHKVNQLKAGLTQREERITALDAELANTYDTIQQVGDKLRASEVEAERQLTEFAASKNKLIEQQQQAASLQSALKDRDFRIDSLATEIKQLNTSLTKAEQQASDTAALWEKRVSMAGSELTAANAQIEELKADAEILRSGLAQREKAASELKGNLTDHAAKSSQLDERIAALTAELDNANKQLKAQQTEKRDLETQKHESERQMVSHQARSQQAEAELAEQVQAIVVHKSMLADRDFKIESLESDIAALRASLDSNSEAGPLQGLVNENGGFSSDPVNGSPDGTTDEGADEASDEASDEGKKDSPDSQAGGTDKTTDGTSQTNSSTPDSTDLKSTDAVNQA